ncbi:MAG: amino acid transporter [Silicimonas sp.]|nr:amino acid transporter [Silicimonas sp.]
MNSFIAGFAMGLSLIVAIGAQNAFVLRQGIRKRHVGAVVLTCVLADAFLIMVGVAGFGVLTKQFPMLVPITKWGGAAFLLVYGLLCVRRAVFVTETLETSGSAEQSLKAAVLTCLALTWLNPHVYLDTVVLLGAVATQYGDERWIFGVGAVAASTAFFLTLGYGAALLQPFFASPRSWRILDAAVAALMWSIALALIFS